MKAQKENPSNKIVEGMPSKELFISMLIKDITFKDAIGDLIDNSVDAANKNSNNNDLSKFEIKIILDKNRFEIIDNAGGIEEDIARNSAFKLGKPKNYTFGKHTIGQFGIGMKRAFFKLGEKISVESIARKSSFKIKINVADWSQKDDKDWNFVFDDVNTNLNNPLGKTGTKIVITDLKEDTKSQIQDPQFIIDLKNEIALEHLFAINKGLKIYVNNDKLEAPELTLIADKDFKPCHWNYKFSSGLSVEIIVGASEDIGEDGGWYIFCNERLILGPDTTNLTGWTGGRGKGAKGEKKSKELPKYHDQYFRFRGFVFFNSDDPTKLPWTTSKTTIDPDSNAYSYVKPHMISLARQVLELMDKMKKEREKGNPEENRKLNNKVDEAKIVPLLRVIKDKKYSDIYKYPENLYNPIQKQRSTEEIRFTKSKDKVKEAKKYFKTDDSDEAGSMAFDYFYQNEIK